MDIEGTPSVAGTDLGRALTDLLGADHVLMADGAPAGARPGDAEQVAQTLRLAAAAGLTVYPGAGDARPKAGGLRLDLSRLSAIVELKVEDMLVVAQAGVRLRDLAAALAPAGLAYPPALLASPTATVGGSLAKGGGARGPRFGPGREYALALRAALPGGELLAVGSRAIKNATGYNLTQALIGSWGALGVIVEATLRLAPRPARTRTLLAAFGAVEAAASAALALADERPPSAAELLDRRALEAGLPALDAAPRAALLILLEGADEAELSELASRVGEVARGHGATDLRWLSGAEAEAAWDGRRELEARLGTPDRGPTVVELALPPAAGVVGAVGELAARGGVDMALFGSVGTGALGVAVLSARDGEDGRRAFCRELAGVVARHGGRVVGATGAGLAYEEWLDLALPPSTATALRLLKSTLDPAGVLRPAALD